MHDITHIPFGHNIEDQTGLLPRHDVPDRFEAVLGDTEVGQVLDTVLARVKKRGHEVVHLPRALRTMEKYLRDAKLLQIYEGTNQIQRLVIARELLED